ncbi:MAG: hypothetical protein H0T42_24400 [Deltaproteobacteria bacterium]|nr:hypothetical protein [Deltaproteobacteria bacterium]
MSYPARLIAFATSASLVIGCASAGSALDEAPVDAGVKVDAPTGPTVDAPLTLPIDAPISPPIDAPPACTTTTTNLLTNPAFDMTPLGMGWVQTPIDPLYPIITPDGTLVQSAPNKAWMAGLARANANDSIYQQVTVPAGTTSLVLTGFYEIRTQEFIGVYDRAKIELVQPGGALIQQAFAKDNSHATTAWTPLSFTFSAPHAGATVRLRLSTASDSTDSTSFFFDSLALTATSCQ